MTGEWGAASWGQDVKGPLSFGEEYVFYHVVMYLRATKTNGRLEVGGES